MLKNQNRTLPQKYSAVSLSGAAGCDFHFKLTFIFTLFPMKKKREQKSWNHRSWNFGMAWVGRDFIDHPWAGTPFTSQSTQT